MNTPKTWLITGCSSGLGRALAEAALAAGDRVIATARDPRSLAELEQHDACRTAALDVTDPAMAEEVIEQAGEFDILVNNAGYGLLGAVEECSEEQARRSMETHFFGPLRLIRAALPMMRRRGSGHLINISAAAAIDNYAGLGIYGAAKAALEQLSESLRLELQPLGIRVTLVEPGPFRTGFLGRGLEKAESKIADYEATVGKFAQLLETIDGRQPGDPALAARAILKIAEAESPPLRLVLGKYANDKVSRSAADLEKERLAWLSVGLPTDFSAGD